MSELVGDEVAWFSGNTVTGLDEASPWDKIGTKDMDGVMDVGTEDGFVLGLET